MFWVFQAFQATSETSKTAAEDGNERALLALKVFAHKVRFYIGAYIAEMNGVDAIVFTAGVGENDIAMRDIICNDLGNLGIKLDLVKNKVRGKEMIISRDDSKSKDHPDPYKRRAYDRKRYL